MCSSCGKVKMKSAPKMFSRKVISTNLSAKAGSSNPYQSFGKPRISFSKKTK